METYLVFGFLFILMYIMQIPFFIMLIALENFLDTPQENLKPGILKLLLGILVAVGCGWIYTLLLFVANVYLLDPLLISAIEAVILWIKSFIAYRKIDIRNGCKKETKKVTRRLLIESVICVIYVILIFILVLIQSMFIPPYMG